MLPISAVLLIDLSPSIKLSAEAKACRHNDKSTIIAEVPQPLCNFYPGNDAQNNHAN